jgi:hypothetical protein
LSYVVSIRRKIPITGQELLAAIESDDQFSIAETGDLSDDSFVLHWDEDNETAREHFVFHHGEVDITSPTNSALEAAQSLAASLGANVVGEEGEDLADVNFPETDSTGCGPFVWAFLGIGTFLVLYWIILE